MVMYLREKIDERKLLNLKIKELRKKLSTELLQDKNEIVATLLEYLNKLQSLNLIISQVNNQTKITIGGAELSLSTALEIRNTLKLKVDVITDLINNNNNLDVLNLQKQRDSMMSEYTAVDSAISQLEWRVRLD